MDNEGRGSNKENIKDMRIVGSADSQQPSLATVLEMLKQHWFRYVKNRTGLDCRGETMPCLS